jgi:uncharacterized repeat protein (TIGR01451 family)
VAGDDVSDIYLNGVYLGQEVGAGAADTFDATPGCHPGINLLSVQLLNNRHGGHAALGGRDHSGLLFNLGAVFTATRPFAAAPATVTAGQTVQFTVDELALGGRKPYSYTSITATAPRRPTNSARPSATSTTRRASTPPPSPPAPSTAAPAQMQMVITVLPATANLLANPVTATYRDANDQIFIANSGAGVELLPVADLAIRKIMSAGDRVPGATITYQITVTNLGPNHVISATVADDPPAALSGVTWTCTASSNAACTASGSGAIADTAAISVGATITYSITGLLAPGATGSLDNTATVAPPVGVTDLITANNSSTDSGELTPMARLGVSKRSSPNPGLPPGGEVRYTIVVTNPGPSDAVGAEIDDAFPAPLDDVTWTCAGSSGSSCTASGSGNIADAVTILAGGAITYNVVAVVDPATAPGVVLANTATAGYGEDDDTATDNNTVVAWTSLAVSKEALDSGGASSRTAPFVDADGNGGISPGDTLKYAVVISNGAEIAYNVLYNDSLDANTALGVGSVACAPAICTVTTGNMAGDAAVSIYLASIPANTAVTINYTATIDKPLPFQVATLANQGYAASANAPAIASDDPATAETEDATTVALAMGMIRGVAWFDDKDGMWEQPGELGIPQVAVTLEYTDTNNQLQQASTNTDANGAYTFTVLAAGQYRVGFGLNEGILVQPGVGQRQGQPGGSRQRVHGGVHPGCQSRSQQCPFRSNLGAGVRLSAAQLLQHDAGAGRRPPHRAGSTGGAALPGRGDHHHRRRRGKRHRQRPRRRRHALAHRRLAAGRDRFDHGDDQRRGAALGLVRLELRRPLQRRRGAAPGRRSLPARSPSPWPSARPTSPPTRCCCASASTHPDFGLQIVDTGLVYNGEVEDYGWYVIRGVVFNDENQNGVQDPGETARVGLPLLVRDRTGAVVATVQTGADGAYLLTGLNAGEYSVEVELPAGCSTLTCY